MSNNSQTGLEQTYYESQEGGMVCQKQVVDFGSIRTYNYETGGIYQAQLYRMVKRIILVSLLMAVCFCAQSILFFGAIPNEDTLHAQTVNAHAISAAIAAANSSTSVGDARIIVIPKGTFYSLPITIHYCNHIVIEIRGKLTACNRIKHWPHNSNRISYQDFIGIDFSNNITVTGGGKVDGRGYIWWLNSWLVTKKYMPAGANRPHLIAVNKAKNLTIHDLVVKNSPCFHIKIDQSIDVTIYNLDIKVNTTAQLGIFKRFYLIGTVPLFPLNTDGIDPNGRNFHIYNITCQNYDDVVVPKPSHHYSDGYANCTENMLIQNITVRLGVGLTIGTVPPNTEINCVRNITFRNAVMEKPFKGIYLKTNPGTNGYGIIDKILYENITMHEPIWWAVYLGPQQQKQPDKGGPGCMFYPFDPKGQCETQPRVNITNVKLKNIRIRGSLLFPIVLRCNETNPCKNIQFQNVDARGWLLGKKDKGYVCQNVVGTRINSYPKLDCLAEVTSENVQEEPESHLQNQQEKFDMKLILERMEQASKQIPYVQDDDQMQSAYKWLFKDFPEIEQLELHASQ